MIFTQSHHRLLKTDFTVYSISETKGVLKETLTVIDISLFSVFYGLQVKWRPPFLCHYAYLQKHNMKIDVFIYTKMWFTVNNLILHPESFAGFQFRSPLRQDKFTILPDTLTYIWCLINFHNKKEFARLDSRIDTKIRVENKSSFTFTLIIYQII